jgi:arsenate reductase
MKIRTLKPMPALEIDTLEIQTMYWLPYCSTCVKAERHLLDRGVSIARYINLKETPLSPDVLQALADGLGGVEALFSKRAMKYRAWGLHEKSLSAEDMLRYMGEEYTFIKRPVIVAATGKTLAGFSARQYDALIAGA